MFCCHHCAQTNSHEGDMGLIDKKRKEERHREEKYFFLCNIPVDAAP